MKADGQEFSGENTNHREANANPGILLLSYAFFPSARVGAKRFSYLSSSLAKRFDLHILTTTERCIQSRDDSLSFSGKIHRAGMYPVFPLKNHRGWRRIWNRVWSSYFCVVDPFSGWIIPAFFKGVYCIKRYKIRVVVATGPPFSTLVIGLLLRIACDVQLVIDYRDPWTNSSKIRCPEGYGIGLNRILEKAVIQHSSHVVVNTPCMKKRFVRHFKNVPHRAVSIITNGFSPHDEIPSKETIPGILNIVYAGNLYGDRSLSSVACALREMMEAGEVRGNGVLITVYGKLTEKDREELKTLNCEGMVRELPRKPLVKLLPLLKGADILMLIIGQDMDYSISYKFYDYLSVRRPILAIVPPESQMEDVMFQLDCGETGYLGDPDSIRRALSVLIKGEKKYSFSGSDEYKWEVLGRRYRELISSVMTEGKMFPQKEVMAWGSKE